MKFVKKPVQIEAIQFVDNVEEIELFIGKELSGDMDGTDKVQTLYIQTLEGNMAASRFDWIIKGVNGEFYPCKPDIFNKTYNVYDENYVLEIDGVGSFVLEKEVCEFFLLILKERDNYKNMLSNRVM